ncbi:MAG: sensor histidine kinase [Ferruginibacter sp.]|nr:sensor histidine kinase [Ferruginibacter sp.]
MAKSKTEEDSYDSLRWRFDVNTFRLLGRELITDRITAVFELVKNCYDANSTYVNVEFQNIKTNFKEAKIIISDNGIGMSFEDIRDKWMVVGTNNKRVTLFTEPPFNRKFVGEKGIGRFAVDKLGERVLIRTKQIGSNKWLKININWDEYENKSLVSKGNNQLSLFTEIDNKYEWEIGEPDEHGTQIIISKISDSWDEKDLNWLYRELGKLVSPFYKIFPKFDIYLNALDFENFTNKQVIPEPTRFYSHHAEIGYDLVTNKQETLKFDKESGSLILEKVEIKSFGPIHLKMFYFNESAKRQYGKVYKNDETRIDGIKIYRDGIITTPFAESTATISKRRDILGIDKRRWQGTFDKVGTREIIGILDIKQSENPKIIDATNRQDFLDNQEYRDLKDFIILQLDAWGELKMYERESKRTLVEIKLLKAGKEVKYFSTELAKIENDLVKNKPDLKGVFDNINAQINELNTVISESISEQKKFQTEVTRKENIYLSLMSLQDYASNISHAIRTSLGKIKRMAEFFKINFPNAKYDVFFKQYANLIYDEMAVLLKVTDFMLSYASSDIDFEDFSIKELIEELLLENYSQTFKSEKINVIVEIKDDFIINANKKFFEDIFQNLIANSIKALQGINNKTIKCSGFLDDNNFTLYFSDNGNGVNKGDEKWIFGLYNTRTAEAGGAGIGLYIVEKRIEALRGTVELVENEIKPKGATFKIKLPFNKT